MIGIAGGAPFSADFSANRWVSSLGSQGSPENKRNRVVGSVTACLKMFQGWKVRFRPKHTFFWDGLAGSKRTFFGVHYSTQLAPKQLNSSALVFFQSK